jgi:hypothetical protein
VPQDNGTARDDIRKNTYYRRASTTRGFAARWSSTHGLSPDLEIRTRSVPTAGHLLALGFEPLGVITHPSGTKTFRFSPNAREALERFLLAKQRLDAMLEGA